MNKPTLEEFLAEVKERWREHAVVECPSCFGDGEDMEDSSRRCDECNGDGVVREGPQPTLADARTDVERLLKIVDLLDERVDHDMTCDGVLTGRCDCGYAELGRRLEALIPGENP